MALTQCAVFYWTSSGILSLKLLADDDTQYASISVPKGQTMFLTDLVRNSKQAGCPDDDACRQLIAKQRGLPALTADDERAAQVDAAGNVVAVLKACPENVQPKDLGLAADNAFVKAHPAAIEGDTYSAGVFSRRYVIADKSSKDIGSVQVVSLDSQPALSASQFAVPSTTLAVGQKAPAPKTATATITPSA